MYFRVNLDLSPYNKRMPNLQEKTPVMLLFEKPLSQKFRTNKQLLHFIVFHSFYANKYFACKVFLKFWKHKPKGPIPGNMCNHITHRVQYKQQNEAHVQHDKSAIKWTAFKVCGSLQCIQNLQTLIQVNSIAQGSIYGTPVRYVTKMWNVVILNKKIYILLSQVYCVWQVVKTLTVISNNPVFNCKNLKKKPPSCIQVNMVHLNIP